MEKIPCHSSINKICRECNEEKPIDSFYNHKMMLDGHLNKCIECVKNRIKKRERILRKDPEWIEKERHRGRDKHNRLYKGKKPKPEVKKREALNYKVKYPEKHLAKSRSSKLKKAKGMHLHHWSYNDLHHRDVIEIDSIRHAFIHRFLTYDQSNFMYRTKAGELLDTKEKHLKYINSLSDNSY